MEPVLTIVLTAAFTFVTALILRRRISPARPQLSQSKELSPVTAKSHAAFDERLHELVSDNKYRENAIIHLITTTIKLEQSEPVRALILAVRNEILRRLEPTLPQGCECFFLNDFQIAIVDNLPDQEVRQSLLSTIDAVSSAPFAFGSSRIDRPACSSSFVIPQSCQSPSTLASEMKATSQLLTSLSMETTLRSANVSGFSGPTASNGSLSITYRPIFSLKNGELHGCEARVAHEGTHIRLETLRNAKWSLNDHPLISELERRVIRTVCLEFSHQDKVSQVWIKISTLNESMTTWIESILRTTALTPDRLILEFDEALLQRSGHRPWKYLRRLRSMKIGIALRIAEPHSLRKELLDAYSLSELTIDSSLVEKIGRTPEAATAIRDIVRIADQYGLTVCADEVATSTQINALTLLCCHTARANNLQPTWPLNAFLTSTFGIARTV